MLSVKAPVEKRNFQPSSGENWHESSLFCRWCESSIIVDGKAVVAILKSTSLKEKFSTVSSRCKTVVACRLAPVQVAIL